MPMNGRNMNGFLENASSSKYPQAPGFLQNDLKMLMMMENSIQANGRNSQGFMDPALAALMSKGGDSGSKFSCGLCFKSFLNEMELTLHLKTHKPSDIDMMMMMMSSAAAAASSNNMMQNGDSNNNNNNHKLGSNFRQQNGNGKPFRCTQCDYQFVSHEDYMKHQEMHLSEAYELGGRNNGDLACGVCNKTFKNLLTYYTHIKTHTELFPQPFICHICKDPFHSDEALEIHKRKVHGKSIVDAQDMSRYSCEAELELNQQEEYDLSTDFSEDGESMQPDGSIHMMKKNWNYKCPNCAAKFREQLVFDYHLLLHKGERPHSCSICAKCFKSRLTLTVHENSHNQKLPPKLLPINLIGKPETNAMYTRNGGGAERGAPPGSYRAVMRPHLEANSDISYKCIICEKVYNNKTELKDHEMQHSVDGEYTCNVCWKKFRSLIGLKIHKNKHVNEMKQQAMTGIPMRVRKEESMVNDIKESELFIEEFNGVDKERPYICRICNKRFKTKHALPYHMLLHTGETPFTCNFCGKGFRSLISLKLHSKKHEDGSWKAEYNNYDQPSTSMNGNSPPSFNQSFQNHDPNMEEHNKSDSLNHDDGIESNPEDENEPNIHDFCAVEMMEPEITISEDPEMHNKMGGPGLDLASLTANFNGSQYAHLMDDEEGLPQPSLHHQQRPEKVNGEDYMENKFGEMAKSDLKFECPICFKRFKNRLSLPYHLMTHERGEPFGCQYCNRKFVSQMKMERHVRNKHFMQVDRGVDSQGNKVEEAEFKPAPTRVGKFKFNCVVCNRKFKTKFSLRIHQKHHHLFKSKRERLKRGIVDVGEGEDGQPEILIDDEDEEDVLYCKLCDKHFTTMAGKEYHMMIHNNIKPYECDHCGKKFRSYSYFKIHAKYHLTNRGANVKKGRPRMFGDFNMNNSYQLSKEYEHLKTDDGSYECNICQKKFKCRQSLPYHMNLHNKNSIFRCMDCNLGFRNSKRLKLHNDTHHGEERESEQQHQQAIVEPEVELVTEPDLPLINGVAIKVEEADPLEDVMDEDMSNPLSTPEPIQLSENDSNSNSMTLNVDPMLIPQIHMGLDNNQGNSQMAPFSGEEDGSRSASTSYVPEMQLIELESGERAYLCLLCKKMCRSKQASVYHRMIHTGEKPYKCEICDKRCRSQANLELHKKMHKNELNGNGNGNSNGSPPMIRKRSRFRISNMSSFDNQPMDSRMDMDMNKWRAYADFKRIRCVECNYKFKSIQALTYHCMIHTGEKPYQCKVCKNSFRSKTNLTLHERSHFPRTSDDQPAPSFSNEAPLNFGLQLESLVNSQCEEVAAPPIQKSPSSCFCIVCEKSFRTDGYVRHHQLLTHQVRTDVNVTELPTIVNSADGYIFKCERCGNCFRTKQYYYYHLNTHHSSE